MYGCRVVQKALEFI